MRIANLAQSNLSNIATGVSRGLRALGHDARSLTFRAAPFGMEADLLWPQDRETCRAVLEAADIVHVNSLTAGFTLWLERPPFRLDTVLRGKRVVVQYHGGDLRRISHPSVKALIARHRVPALVTIPDLIPHLPGSSWLPIPVNPENPQLAPGNPPASPIRICHAPTTRAVKKTDAFLAAVDRLRTRYDVEPVLIENRPYAECLEIKRTCHINFDNIGFGSYALSSIESMLLEQPSLVYLNAHSESAIQEHSAEVRMECPLLPVGGPVQPTAAQLNAFVEGHGSITHTPEDVASIERALAPLVENDGLRREIGRRGREWAGAVHGDRRVARIAEEAYERAPVQNGFNPAERLLQTFWWGVTSTKALVKETRA